MPVYQTEVSQLAESLSSVIIAAPEDSEIRVGLDGPYSQEGLELLTRLQTTRGIAKLHISHFPRQGLVATLNALIRQSDCCYLARQDADDVCLPQRLQLQLRALDGRPSYSFCGTQMTRCDDRLHPHQRQRRYPTSFKGQLIYASLLNNPIAHPTLMIKRELLQQSSYLPVPGAEDWDLYIRLWQEGYRSFNLDQSGLLYRMHHKQITQQKRNRQSLQGLKARSLEAANKHYRGSSLLKPLQRFSNAIHLTEMVIKAKPMLDR